MKRKVLSAITILFVLASITTLVIPVYARAGEISGPGTPDGSEGTYWWYRDNKWTSKDQFWGNRGHLKLKAGKTYVFTWRDIDDSEIIGNPTKEAWHVFVMDAGKGSHGWEQIVLQTRKDEAWVKNFGNKVIRGFVNWGGIGQIVVPADAILDLRIVLRQNTGDDKWHIECWYNIGDGWTQFINLDDVDISTGLPGDLTQTCAGIQIDKDSDGTLSFKPAAP